MLKEYQKLLEEKTGKSFEELLKLPTEDFKKVLEKVSDSLTLKDLATIAKGINQNSTVLGDNISVGTSITISKEEHGIRVEGSGKGVISLIELTSIALGKMLNNIREEDIKKPNNLEEVKKETLEVVIETIKMSMKEND